MPHDVDKRIWVLTDDGSEEPPADLFPEDAPESAPQVETIPDRSYGGPIPLQQGVALPDVPTTRVTIQGPYADAVAAAILMHAAPGLRLQSQATTEGRVDLLFDTNSDMLWRVLNGEAVEDEEAEADSNSDAVNPPEDPYDMFL